MTWIRVRMIETISTTNKTLNGNTYINKKWDNMNSNTTRLLTSYKKINREV